MTKKIKVAALFDMFEIMEEEHLEYEYGATREGEVNCSGACVYASDQLGEPDVLHSSSGVARINYIELLLISEAKPGYAALKWCEDFETSGGATLSERAAMTVEKHTNTKRSCPFPDFAGDQMDARSLLHMMADMLSSARVHCHDGAVLVAFCDWRRLPLLADAVQWEGWMRRGTIVWDKMSSRPQRGRSRQQAEFAIWAKNGKLPFARRARLPKAEDSAFDYPVPALPDVFQAGNVQGVKRLHKTQKPLELMRSICQICVPGGRILDPFAGSGPNLAAAQLEGYDSIGVEFPDIAKTASERLQTL